MISIKKQFKDAEDKLHESQIAAALHRHDADLWQTILFDWTCEWGTNWSHPLKLLSAVTGICTFAYWIGLHLSKRSGIVLLASGLSRAL